MDRRTILAFVICGLLTLVWLGANSALRAPARETPQPQAPAAQETALEAAARPTVPPPAELPQPAKPPAPAVAPAPAIEARDDIRLPEPGLKYQTVWSNRGACLRQARLPDYPQATGSEEGVLLLDGLPEGPGTFMLRDPKGLLPLDTQVYEVKQAAGSLTFSSAFPGGLAVRKEFVAESGKYEMKVRITLQNTSDKPLTAQYQIFAAARILPEEGASADLTGAIGLRSESGAVKIERIAPGKVRKGPSVFWNNSEKPLAWAGATNRYFAVALKPVAAKDAKPADSVTSASVEYLPQSEEVRGMTGSVSRADNVTVTILAAPRELQRGESVSDDYVYFLGPKKRDVLEAHPDMVGLLDYGMFGFFSKLLLDLLHVFYWVVPNYGVGIILMTILVKVCLFPMTRKGQIAMQKMQKLQPLMREIQEKYKDDKQRQGKETMDLYRKHGANPMSGCWPMLFQLPILWGLFRMLQYSIDLRQQGFLPWWITDLSQPDTVGHIAGVPINILPILMVISWVAQQFTMPKPADPQQAQTQKMMMFMPIIFGFMFYRMASGLTLYWLVSTFLGIVEQKLIKAQIHKMDARGAFAPAAVETAEAKSARGKFKRK